MHLICQFAKSFADGLYAELASLPLSILTRKIKWYPMIYRLNECNPVEKGKAGENDGKTER